MTLIYRAWGTVIVITSQSSRHSHGPRAMDHRAWTPGNGNENIMHDHTHDLSQKSREGNAESIAERKE